MSSCMYRWIHTSEVAHTRHLEMTSKCYTTMTSCKGDKDATQKCSPNTTRLVHI